MRLRQKYEISRKPRNMQELNIAEHNFSRMVKADLSILAKYLDEEGAIRVDWKGESPLDAFERHILSGKDTTESYYHIKGLTLKVGISTYTKDWLIPDRAGKKWYHTIPKGVDVIIDIHGKGSAKLRQDMRKKVFGKETRKIIRSF